MTRPPRPSALYTLIGLASWPVLGLLFRYRTFGRENLPASEGYVLAAGHLSNLDPWAIGLALWPRRFLRFMAKSELFWFPLGPIIRGCGAFKVNRGRADLAAIETAVTLAREGNVIAMFPEGTRRKKGLRKTRQAAAHSGAARIALLAGVPLVPAGIKGTDGLRHLQAWRVRYGQPIPLDDLRELDDRRGLAPRDRPVDGGDSRARGVVVSGTLLAIDGDSLAHRAYHAIPKSIRGNGRPANALVGFAGFLTRLWDAEQPEAVLVGWDTLEVPTYRHEALPAYQSGREFEDALLEQLNRLPALTESFGFQIGKAPGYEADDFLAAAARAWPGPVTVVTSDRDAFQLVSDRVAILQPVKGVSELTRIGPAEVRERYGVEPSQAPDFIALRGDPSDKIPGAPGVGPKKAADVLKQHGSLAQALADGRFPQIADDLMLYLSIATMDGDAPLPKLRPTPPDWAGASAHAAELGLDSLANRLAERS